MEFINNLLKKDISAFSIKERQLIIDYFRHLVNKEFNDFKKKIIQKDKQEIFEYAYLIDTYNNIKIQLNDLTFSSIIKLLTHIEKNFIDYMYNADVNDGVFDYYEDIEDKIYREVSKITSKSQLKVA